MRFTIPALSAFALVNAAILQNEKRDAALEVTLTPANGAAGHVLATVKNVGTVGLNLLTLQTLLDAAPIQKLDVIDETSKPQILLELKYSIFSYFFG
jgi:hypothetical protein